MYLGLESQTGRGRDGSEFCRHPMELEVLHWDPSYRHGFWVEG